MSMTLEQIVEEAGHLPAEQVAELVDRLSEQLHLDKDIEDCWRTETRRRVSEILSGSVEGIPGPEVAASIRGIIGP